MAETQTIETRLQLVFEDSIDEITGKVSYKVKSFNNVKTSATTDALFLVTQALVPLQSKVLSNVKRNNSILITEA